MSVPDVEVTADFYGRVLGLRIQHDLPGGGLRLGWGAGHHVIDLTPGETGLSHYGFEVRDDDGITKITERVKAAGYACTELPQSFIDYPIGSPHGIAVVDPDGTTVHFHGAVERQGENAADPGRRPIKFQHITVGTVNVEPMAKFFVNVVGFRISDQLEDGRFAWLRSNRDHHTLAVVNVGRAGILDHYSYDLAEWENFKTWCDRLTDAGVTVSWGPGRHGPGNNLFIFFEDPAGNHVELSAEMEKFHDDRVTYVARQWKPIPSSVNLWGGQLPHWRKTSQED
ncbi:VOC family protein [Mycobacterium sp. CPCC 205710]|uniref:VOC family protein n=1 Tax=Mycobacterium deserti TaxID=2978347 RepID=A0ABT2M6Y0_9MYCO|nr:VOC family protein [Mycobacterium deserti]MCT7658023.1 VOC family protein [Mycobacterium deserti]